MLNITVSNKKNTECDFTSIAAALNSLSLTDEPATIRILEGFYHECIEITRPNITIIGDGPDKTEICNNRYALQLMPDGHKRGTFRTQTLFIDADNVSLKNICIRNSAGCGRKFGQALALYADGDKLSFENVHLIGNQDTLFTGPLPPTAYEIGGFTGPKEFCPRRMSHQLYRDCYIEGNIDFIFGSARAWFENCEIFSSINDIPGNNSSNDTVQGYITAASTPEGEEFGYVFNKCRFTSNCPDNSVYLGRPWRNFAKTVLINCELGPHIRKEGWHDWNKPESHAGIYYAEYGSTGAGAGIERAVFASTLSEDELKKYKQENVIGF